MATFTNQATLTYNGQTTTSNVTVGELTETLTAAKTAVVPTYGTDGRVTYILSLVNSGTAPLTGLTITDDLGGYTFNAGTVYPLSYTAGSVRYYQNGVLQAAPAVTAGPPLTFTGITVPAGGNAVIAYEAVPTAFAPPTAEGLSAKRVSSVPVAAETISSPVRHTRLQNGIAFAATGALTMFRSPQISPASAGFALTHATLSESSARNASTASGCSSANAVRTTTPAVTQRLPLSSASHASERLTAVRKPSPSCAAAAVT